MPESVSTRSAYKMLTCIYLCRTLLFFAPYADFLLKKHQTYRNHNKDYAQSTVCSKEFIEYKYPYQDCRKRF